MTEHTGQQTVESLGSKDLNKDGEIINLAIVGSSRFYDFEIFERITEDWIEKFGYPDLIIVGGASGVDYMAERWADANIIPIAIFSEEWTDSKRSLIDQGREEAANTLTEKILNGAKMCCRCQCRREDWICQSWLWCNIHVSSKKGS